MVLAQSHLLNGDVDAATATATTAVQEGGSVQSARFLRYVTDFQSEVSPHAPNPAVQQFDEVVRVLLADLNDE
jgi:hypothetical protein